MGSTFPFRLGLALADKGPLCVGIDPSKELLDAWGLDDEAEGVERLARTAIEAVAGVAGVVKVQVAFFERHGAAGYIALERVLGEAFEAGLVVIGDAKRGDIPTTNLGYADAWLRDDSPLCVDALTVSCYLGVQAMSGLFELAHRTGRGVFAVAASSNNEGRVVQTARLADGRTVESGLLDDLREANKALDAGGEPVHCIGAVVGAQRRPEGLEVFEGPVLVPGIGAQGAGTDDVKSLLAIVPHDLVTVTVSRGILAAGPSLLALRSAASSYASDLQ
ncbi:MAG TPA: orotidine-5'-phosphate decarboxylase [Acidimicrobiales bacterium]|jgi:orotidine-5'-phosphate decarboxylase